MTTTTRKANSKPAQKRAAPLPPEAAVIVIAGKQYLLAPMDRYDDWLQDQLLTAVAADRLEHGPHSSVPFGEAKKRLLSRKKGE